MFTIYSILITTKFCQGGIISILNVKKGMLMERDDKAFVEVRSNGNLEKVNDELAGQFTEKSVTEYISDASETLGMLEKLRLEKKAGRELSKQLTSIAIDLLRKQREHMEHKLLLSLDMEKKKLYNNYIRNIDGIQREIISFTSDAEKGLVQVMNDSIDSIFEMKIQRKAKLSLMKEKNLIDDEEYKEEVERINSWSDKLNKNAEAKITLILQKHARAFEETIELFKSKPFKPV